MNTQVAVTKCAVYDYELIYKKISESVNLLGGMSKFVGSGEKVLIKPNLLSGKAPEKAITTHPLVVKAVVQLVKEAGGKPSIGDSPAIGSWAKITEETGMKKIAQETNTPLIPFENEIQVNKKEETIFKNLAIARELKDFDKIINIPKIKTHCQMVLTLAVKNMFGCVVGKKKAQWHMAAGRDARYFARLLLEIYEEVNPCLTIVDGIIGLEGDGPGSAGIPRQIGVIVSGSDCVAIDVVITEILGAKKESLFTTLIAKEMGLGETNLQNIKVLGETIAGVKVKNFIFPIITGVEFGTAYFRKPLKNLLTTKPFIDKSKCTLCYICISACPCKVMVKNSKGKAFPLIDFEKCIRCYCCLEVCPEGAITPKKGLAAKLLGI